MAKINKSNRLNAYSRKMRGLSRGYSPSTKTKLDRHLTYCEMKNNHVKNVNGQRSGNYGLKHKYTDVFDAVQYGDCEGMTDWWYTMMNHYESNKSTKGVSKKLIEYSKMSFIEKHNASIEEANHLGLDTKDGAALYSRLTEPRMNKRIRRIKRKNNMNDIINHRSHARRNKNG